MDPISIALAKSGIPAAIQSATELINKLFGPAAEETGNRLQNAYLINKILLPLNKRT